MSIIEKLYGGGGKQVPASKQPGKPASGSGYYSSFGYYDDLQNNRPPPPASQGGPTNLELAQHEGYADEKGMLSNGMHSTISAMYGGGIQPISAGNKSMNPDYAGAIQNNSTVGGIGNTDAYGNKIYWSPPLGDQLTEGEAFTTPAGTYTVSKNPWGQFVLIPEDGAPGAVGPYLTNMTHGEHHLGIDPNTGQVWYQKAAGYTNFSGGGDSYTQVDGAPVAPNDPNNGNDGANSGKSWLEVLGDKDLSSEFPEDSPWRSSGRASLSRENSEGARQGLFAGLKEAEYYKRILESLGVV